MLTKKQREFIRGEYEYEGEYASQKRYQQRKAIRERVRNSLYDFTELFEHLDENEREKIFSPPEDEREPLNQALINLVAFLYKETHVTTTLPNFEYYLKSGVRRATYQLAGSDMYDVDVDFEVRRTSPQDVEWDKIEDKIRFRKWDEFTEGELKWFLRYYAKSDEFDPEIAHEEFEKRFEQFVAETQEAGSQKAKASREKQRPRPDPIETLPEEDENAEDE
ncbi:hypothetical protein [Haladaptatus salinisoli]|uniref:hypothetical protein n=1 Tax=Haladaptatus salinisoli TaxID=2884876 RepID=UPI001D09E992|nr:hypothetical protein [Haladaptatus salinisoli]